MKKKKECLLKKWYLESFDFIKESKDFIYSGILVFLIFAVIGGMFPIPEIIYENILEFLNEILAQTEGMNARELSIFIFKNNLTSSFLAVFLGIFLGVFPLMAAISNGYILGFVVSRSVSAEGILIIWRLFPHGIFELPAVFISIGLGIKLGSFIIQKNKLESLKDYSLNSLKVFILIVLPLLILAALIEGSLIYFLS